MDNPLCERHPKGMIAVRNNLMSPPTITKSCDDCEREKYGLLARSPVVDKPTMTEHNSHTGTLAHETTHQLTQWTTDMTAEEIDGLPPLEQSRLTDFDLEDILDDTGVEPSVRALIEELRELREIVVAQDASIIERDNTITVLRAENAALVAAGNRLSICYETCICELGSNDPDCKGWPMLWDALASVKEVGE